MDHLRALAAMSPERRAAIVTWARRRIGPAQLSDNDTERLMVACSTIASAILEPETVPALLNLLHTLHDAFGDAGYVAFVEQLQSTLDDTSDTFIEPAPEEIRRAVANRERQEREKRAHDELKQCHVCDKCGRLRKGPRWVKGNAPVGYYVWRDYCPDCE